MASLGNADTTGFSEEQISGMRGFSSVTEMNEYDAKKREEVKNENGNVKTDSYDTTGGLPATLRYPNTALDDSMDFLVIRISDFVPAGLKLSGLVTVDKKKTKETNDDVVSAGADLLDETKNPFSLTTATTNNKNQKAKHTIYLPIPRQVQDSNNVQYGNGTLNPLEAFGTGLVAGG